MRLAKVELRVSEITQHQTEDTQKSEAPATGHPPAVAVVYRTNRSKRSRIAARVAHRWAKKSELARKHGDRVHDKAFRERTAWLVVALQAFFTLHAECSMP